MARCGGAPRPRGPRPRRRRGAKRARSWAGEASPNANASLSPLQSAPCRRRFDPETLTLDLAVADLLDAELLRHIGFGNRGGYERLWLGQAIHSRYQEEALAGDGTYRREVACSWPARPPRLEGAAARPHRRPAPRGRRLRWSSRRSSRCAAAASSPPTAREIYERQALLYAWMLRQLSRASAGARRAGADRDRRRRGRARAAGGRLRGALEAEVRRRLNALLRAYEAERAAVFERRARRRAAALPLPELAPRARSASSRRSSRRRSSARPPAARGPHRHRQDGRGALPGPALRPARTTSGSSCSPPRRCSRTWR